MSVSEKTTTLQFIEWDNPEANEFAFADTPRVPGPRKPLRLVMSVRPGTDPLRRQDLLDTYYRALLREAVPPLIEKWEPLLGVNVQAFFVQRMKTRWGSCNHRAGTIRLNAELAKKPYACLEYLIVHEMVHLLEPTHNARFVALMDHYLPTWKHHRDELNRLPVRHEDWHY